MKLGYLFIILFYYGLVGLLILVLPTSITSDASSSTLTGDINITEQQEGFVAESWFGTFFNVLGSIGRFFGLLLFGVGLPSAVPSMIALIFATWQTIITMFTAGLIISALQGN